MKTYTNPSNTKRAAKSAIAKQLGLTTSEVVFGKDFIIEAVEGGFTWEQVSTAPTLTIKRKVMQRPVTKFVVKRIKMVRRTILAPVVGNFTYCPHCNVHLDNGVSDYETQLDVTKQNRDISCMLEREFLCLGCGEEFGNVVEVVPPMPKAAPKTTGLKIQKNREERNGIKRPSEGGKCFTLWAMFDAMYGERGIVPTPKPAKERSAKENMDPTTTTVQLYRWREFMGFKGR